MLEGLKILLVGILVVMAVLIMLWVSCAVIGLAFKAAEAMKARARDRRTTEAAQPSALPPQAAPATSAGAVPAHHLAAIAAAAAAVLDRPVRVLRVQVPPLQSSQWTNQGRLDTFQSHRLQGDWGGVVPGLTQDQIQSR
ncbi:OadG family transporter subunit [Roseospira visakhapatnamensis]|uniref:Na+-transporting methylmalonyl-CoA/oxaloacetate decarboxylase gamma subunit n=1 Tax=Roseospira visakhapatnamensis TaxID=390880 RepID=A0A7W6REJ1_9PROT|nr:OadG family transporter subunit [Roseospira visakhapatnamensis]MBB4266962.1 Na+-transporting methylmalonyl-CoA/oxaloacetate decarboxylase gamma subunit [Roseospira visakhapatnamensis]